jgi:hypothetical protein
MALERRGCGFSLLPVWELLAPWVLGGESHFLELSPLTELRRQQYRGFALVPLKQVPTVLVASDSAEH